MDFTNVLSAPSRRLTAMTNAVVAISVAAVIVAGCGNGDRNIVRGRGLHVAQLSPTARAQVYEAALRGAFDDITNPALVLLLHPRILPRTERIDGGDSVPPAIVSTLRNDGIVQGRCDPQPVAKTKTPRCNVSRPGYVVRFSDVLQLRTDTVEVFVTVTTYNTPDYPHQQLIQFENVYQVAKTANGWSAAREGRVPKDVK